MVAATGAVMGAVTTGPAVAANQAAGAATGGDATQGAGDFMQMIAVLLGGAPAPAVTTPATQTTTAAPASSEQRSDDDAKKPTDASLTDMLAMGMPLPFAPTPPAPAPVADTASSGKAASEVALDALSSDGKAAASSGTLDALRLQQLSKTLSKDTPATKTSTDEGAAPQGIDVASLFGKSAAAETSQTPSVTDKGADFLRKLQELTDVSSDKSANTETQRAGLDSLQQANIAVVKQDAGVDQRPQQLVIHSHVGSHEWAGELGNKLTLMNVQNTQSASLQLTPDHLGPVEVKIEVNQGQTSVWFTADQAETRTALEQSLPKLREMFAAQGMQLADAGVFGQRSNQQQQSAPTFGGNTGATASVEDIDVEQLSASRILSLGMLDTYA